MWSKLARSMPAFKHMQPYDKVLDSHLFSFVVNKKIDVFFSVHIRSKPQNWTTHRKESKGSKVRAVHREKREEKETEIGWSKPPELRRGMMAIEEEAEEPQEETGSGPESGELPGSKIARSRRSDRTRQMLISNFTHVY